MIKFLLIPIAAIAIYAIVPHLMGMDGIQLLCGLFIIGLSAQAIRLVLGMLDAMTTFRR